MTILVSNTIRITEPTQEVVKWCDKNLVLSNPEYIKKQRMGFWVGNTPKKLYLYEKDGNDLILPFGILKSLPNFFFHNAEVIPLFHDSTYVYYGDPVPLYDYQKEAVEYMYYENYGILQSPAGSGKTQMGIALIKKFGRKALWLTHTADLLNQSKQRAEMYMDKSLIGTITEGKIDIGLGVTFATVQTMANLDLPSLRNTWDVIIVDECHRVCGTPTAMGQFYKVLNNLSARHKIGLSATVHRSDGLIEATYAILGRVEYVVPTAAVASTVMPVKIHPVSTETELSYECLNTDGTICYTSLISYLTKNENRNKVIVDTLVKDKGMSSLILSDRLEHLKTLISMLPEDMQKDAVMVDGKMTSKKGKAEREQAIEDMKSGRKKYLFASYRLAKEGLDIPCLERLHMATPQKDYAVVTQSVGRIARVFEGKADPICYDYVDDIPMLIKSYKARCRIYRKGGYEIL